MELVELVFEIILALAVFLGAATWLHRERLDAAVAAAGSLFGVRIVLFWYVNHRYRRPREKHVEEIRAAANKLMKTSQDAASQRRN